eukprot:12863179-Alexandrium_andersonii.AAC.1
MGDIDQVWSKLATTAQGLAELRVPPPAVKPRRPWISHRTLSLIEARARLVHYGNWRELTEQNKLINSSAKRDRAA